MTHTLPELTYDINAFSDFCSAVTFEYHHGKHHNGYVTKLNAAIEGTPYADMPLEKMIVEAHKADVPAVYNNAAQHFNHSFFWNCLSPEELEIPDSVKAALDSNFGSVEKFKEEFTAAAASLFGSGWAWLAQKEDGSLEILKMSNADTPVIEGKKPILTLDVWEHAYYIDHRNARPMYIERFWNHVNWKFVAEQLV